MIRIFSLGLMLVGIALAGCGKAGDRSGYCPIGLTVQTQPSQYNLGTTVGDGKKAAQAFSISTAVTIKSFKIMLVRTGYPQGNLTIHLQKDVKDPQGTSTNTPDGVDLRSIQFALTGADGVSTIGNNAQFYTFALPEPLALTANTKYWVLITANYSPPGSSSNTVSWLTDTSGTYTGGMMITENGSNGSWQLKPTWAGLLSVCE